MVSKITLEIEPLIMHGFIGFGRQIKSERKVSNYKGEDFEI